MRVLAAAVLLFLCGIVSAAETLPVAGLNQKLKQCRSRCGFENIRRADDAVFFRRLSFDVRGKLPKADEVRAFLRDRSADKRERLIEEWVESEDFALLMGMRYCDMFRVKSEFPVNLWPNAVQLFHRYLCDVTRKDRSWKVVAEELLTRSGSNFRIAPANFFRANGSRTPEGMAAGTALTLMNFRTENLAADERAAFAAFFSRIRFKSTKEWKEEIVYTDPAPAVVEARTPDGKWFTIHSPAEDPRAVFANWLTAPENPFFACAYVNRVWYWLFGRGIAEPADDMPLPKTFFRKFFGGNCPNDPVDPELLDFLAEFFQKSGYRTKTLCKLILNSDAYQADWRIPEGADVQKAMACFAVYPVRRLESEIFTDALAELTKNPESYSSVIPEPFTFLPKGTPAVAINDGSISSALLDKFGRPSRDSGKISERNNHNNDAQRLYVMNSTRLYNGLGNLNRRVYNRKMSGRYNLENAYLTILSRYPTKEECRKFNEYRNKLPEKMQWRAWNDLLFALVNSREFCSHH